MDILSSCSSLVFGRVFAFGVGVVTIKINKTEHELLELKKKRNLNRNSSAKYRALKMSPAAYADGIMNMLKSGGDGDLL